MLWRAVLLGTGFCVSSCSLALAQDAGALLQCPSISDEKLRLSCFDTAVQAKPPEAKPEQAAEDRSAPTKEIIATPSPPADTAPQSYKLVDASDLYVAPGKYEGKPIEIKNIRCYHADKDEYRCTPSSSTPLVIFTLLITPSEQKNVVENECGELRKMLTSPKCIKTARFIPIKHDSDISSGYQRRVIILAKSVDLVAQEPSRKRGR